MDKYQLMEEAKKRGFSEESIINAPWLKKNVNPVDTYFEYYEHSNCLFFGCVLIYDNGRWATIGEK